jgi:FSR family fosmidomycin resistance protein-like MFS transporter
MDVQPERRERNMAWWTLAGSVGVVAGPLLLAVAVASGLGWRAITVATGLAALPLVAAARWAPLGSEDGEPLRAAARSALGALRRRDVLRWLAVLESSDLMLDVLHGFLALYLVDVAGARPRDAGLALAVWTGAGLAGDLLLIPVLGRVAGVRYLRLSAAAVAFVYPEFLLVDGLGAKLALLAMLGLLNSGWYAIPKAGLYAAMPGRSGAAIAIGTAGGLVGALIPLTLGLVAERAGLAPTMWLLAAAPVLLLVLLPRDRAGRL